MNLYERIASAIGTTEAIALGARLAAWHDSMVAHERRLRLGADVCDDECPHAEAPALWREAVEIFGPRAQELTFLRARAADRSSRAARHVSEEAAADAEAWTRDEDSDGRDVARHSVDDARAAAEL